MKRMLKFRLLVLIACVIGAIAFAGIFMKTWRVPSTTQHQSLRSIVTDRSTSLAELFTAVELCKAHNLYLHPSDLEKVLNSESHVNEYHRQVLMLYYRQLPVLLSALPFKNCNLRFLINEGYITVPALVSSSAISSGFGPWPWRENDRIIWIANDDDTLVGLVIRSPNSTSTEFSPGLQDILGSPESWLLIAVSVLDRRESGGDGQDTFYTSCGGGL